MPSLLITDAGGDLHSLHAEAGESVMEVARAAGLPVLGECNGSMACATCHVIVDPAWAGHLATATEEEEATLDTLFRLTPTSRLGCQIRVGAALDGLRLTLPQE